MLIVIFQKVKFPNRKSCSCFHWKTSINFSTQVVNLHSKDQVYEVFFPSSQIFLHLYTQFILKQPTWRKHVYGQIICFTTSTRERPQGKKQEDLSLQEYRSCVLDMQLQCIYKYAAVSSALTSSGTSNNRTAA